MKKAYEAPDAEVVILHADTAIAYIPGTDSARSGLDADVGSGNGPSVGTGTAEIPRGPQ